MPSDFITLTCPSCGAKLSVAPDADRFTCDYCQNEHILRQTAGQTRILRPEVGQPANVVLQRDGQSARIVQRWFSLKYIPMAFFAIAWDSFLVFWYTTAFSHGAPWIMVVFPIAHVAVGIGITYSVVAGFLNRTMLEVRKDEIEIWYEPLPWLGETTVKIRDVKQFFCKEKMNSSRNSTTTTTYELYVLTRDNHSIKLLSNLENPDTALFFEQQLETWLKIVDQPVEGELARG